MRFSNINGLCDIVRETSFAIHKYHRNGHLEKPYENALVHRLRNHGLHVEQQHPLTVYDEDGTVLGEYFADLFIDNCLIVELKAIRVTTDEHVAQLLGYLKSSRVEVGLLINFGAAKLYVKKYLNECRLIAMKNTIRTSPIIRCETSTNYVAGWVWD